MYSASLGRSIRSRGMAAVSGYGRHRADVPVRLRPPQVRGVPARRRPTLRTPSKHRAHERKPAIWRARSTGGVEATTGFEPVNRGFADLRVEPLHHVARCRPSRVAPGSMAAPRGFEPRFTDPKSAVLP